MPRGTIQQLLLKGDGMKKGIESEEIRPVDFSSGVRGKHCAAYRRGHTVKVRQDDGTITVQKFVPDSDAVEQV